MATHDSNQPEQADPLGEAIQELEQASRLKKCRRCGCMQQAVASIERAHLPVDRAAALHEVLSRVRSQLTPMEYDCLGCADCYPNNALDALGLKAVPRSSDEVEPRQGWPPLPGAYTVLRYRAPVAVCTLTDTALAEQAVRLDEPALGVVGTLQTENLGIERLVQNVCANPHLRFLIVCGADSKKPLGTGRERP